MLGNLQHHQFEHADQSTVPISPRTNGFELSAILALALILFAVYFRVMPAPLLYDDESSIVNNPSITSLWPLVGSTNHRGPLSPPPQIPTSGRPLVNLSLAVNYHFGGLNPAGYHAVNLAIHTLSAVLVALIIRHGLLLGYFGWSAGSASGALGILVALLWALHPLQTETIAYVTQRTELLVSFFYLATVYGSLRYWVAFSQAGRTAWLIFSVLSCFAGMASKEVMVTAPVMVLLFDRTFVTGTFRGAVRKSWTLYLGLFASWGLLFALNITGPRSGSAGFHLNVSLLSYWIAQAKAFFLYLKLAFWPSPLLLHYQVPLTGALSTGWPWLVLFIFVVSVSIALLWRRSIIGYAIAWIIAILSPTLVVPIVTEVIAERRMYLPLVALVALLVLGSYQAIQAIQIRKPSWRSSIGAIQSPIVITTLIALIPTMVWSLLSYNRIALYRTPLTLWSQAATLAPEDFVIQYNLGHTLVQEGRPLEAAEYFRKATQLNPNYADAYNNLGNTQKVSDHLAEAISNYEQALRIKPDFPTAHFNLGLALEQTGRYEEAISHFQAAVTLKPDWVEAWWELGNSFVKTGRLNDAIQSYEDCLRVNPDYPQGHAKLGQALFSSGDPAKAADHIRRAVQLAPQNASFHNNLGAVLTNSGQLNEAVDEYELALRLDPKLAEAHNNLGNALQQSGRYNEAVDHYKTALKLDEQYAQASMGLALAYSKMDRPSEAISAAEQAERLAQSTRQFEFAKQIQDWLRTYKSKTSKKSDAPQSTN